MAVLRAPPLELMALLTYPDVNPPFVVSASTFVVASSLCFKYVAHPNLPLSIVAILFAIPNFLNMLISS